MADSGHESLELSQHAYPLDSGGSETLERQPLIRTPSNEDPYSQVRFGTIQLFQPWFPEVNPDDPRSQGWLRKLSHRGVALIVHQSIALLVLAFNISVTTYVLHNYDVSRNIGDVFGPDDGTTCNEAKQYNRWLHLAINVLSTVLLGSSNYCAQLLVAPTRRDVNNAHGDRKWFDIGVQSMHNLRRINGHRRTLWVLLMVSSGLLHLIWNSAIFMAIPVSQNSVALVTSDFLEDNDSWDRSAQGLIQLRKNATNAEHLTPEECIRRYVKQKAGLTDILVVSANITMSDGLSFDTNVNSSLLSNFTCGGGVDWAIASSWMCSARAPPGQITKTFCTEQSLLTNGSNAPEWTYFGVHFRGMNDLDKFFWSKVDHCLTGGLPQPMDDKCALRLSSAIMIMNPNTTEDTRSQYDKLHLVTIGDAVASFLEYPDQETYNMRIVEKKDFSSNQWPIGRPPRQPEEVRWFRAATTRRWLTTISLCITMLSVVSILLGITIKSQKEHGILTDISSLWGYGVGGTQLWATALTTLMRKMKFTAGFFFATLFVNMFQVIVSALYLLYNNLLTVLLVSAEWNDFITERKTLRVSCSRGIQRSSYFLSLPYKYSITLMVWSGLLHWMISQSVFVIQTVGYKSPDFKSDRNLDASVIGYSSIGIILSMVIGGIMVIALVSIGFFAKYNPKKLKDTPRQQDPLYPMPLVSTCSAAISAACHRHDEDKDAHLLPVRWGYVTIHAGQDPGRGEGRFCFTTARAVQYPPVEDVYMDHDR